MGTFKSQMWGREGRDGASYKRLIFILIFLYPATSSPTSYKGKTILSPVENILLNDEEQEVGHVNDDDIPYFEYFYRDEASSNEQLKSVENSSLPYESKPFVSLNSSNVDE